MSDQLPAVPDDEEKRAQEKFDMMSGKEGLEVFCSELREKGINLPARDVWKHATRRDIEVATHAAFSLLGGIPGLALWAHKNPNLFYPAYMKLAPAEATLGGGANIFINTQVPESPLDSVEIDAKTGKIKGFKGLDDD